MVPLDIDDMLVAQPVQLLGGDAWRGTTWGPIMSSTSAARAAVGLTHLLLVFGGLDGYVHYLV